MLRYIIAKATYMMMTLLVIITATFFLMKAIPGDPFSQEKAVPQEILDALYDHYGLRDPWYVQYGRYVMSILEWDLGPSFKYKGRTVNEIINDGFPVSAALGLEALILSLGLGLTLGTTAALNQNRWQDYASMLIAVIGVSVPSFILASLLQYIFAIKLNWLPVARWGTVSQSILPALSLAALPTAFIARLTRASMLEVLQQDYIRTARAKGISELQVVLRHGLRNAILPVVSYLGQLTVNILVGSFIIEKIFGIPGLGQWFVTSVINRDYTVIMGTTVFYSIVLLAAIFIVDILYAFIDPRITHTVTEEN
ncbi:MAG: ABC transporter permease [Chlamydiia bacterium]|nr:ABC transporter permease [Chlamydiia bacterium]